jgi:hypothetical protein
MNAVRGWFVALLVSISALPAHGSSHETALEAVTVELVGEGVAIDLKTSPAPSQHRVQWLDAPTRLLVDLADTRLTWAAGRVAGTGSVVKEVRAAQVSPSLARVVIETSHKVPYRVDEGSDGLRVLFAAGEAEQAAAPAGQPERRSGPRGPRLFGIVHGNRGWVAFIEDPESKRVEPYQVGQSVGSAVVERIEAESITLKGPAGTVRLRLRGEPARFEARPR